MKQPIRISFRNARSPNSRGCLSINLNNRTPTKPGRSIEKGKTDGADPRQKKYQKKRRKNKKMSTKKKKKKKSGVGGISKISSAYCPDIPPHFPLQIFFVFSVFFYFPSRLLVDHDQIVVDHMIVDRGCIHHLIVLIVIALIIDSVHPRSPITILIVVCQTAIGNPCVLLVTSYQVPL